uniref:Ubiquitin-like domain-containing protein CIP73 isoform X5 n=1 Tax=Cicer arietinum TaxID=3827 RepID=A0A1S3E751_CICAR|nr:ubiquitin-like domain-containing protein CIP73 isoform X5 [Cicer arietinum]
MEGQCSNEGSSTGNISGESSDSTVQLNIKTLDSGIYSFQVDKNMPVTLFKEKIANETGVPVSQQRLIFRGKVLKDEHVLSDYHVENGHTLHLVERQPNQSQTSGTGSGETTSTNGNRGNDVGSGAPRNRVGQISHSVVLGTFNVGEQGEGTAQDLTRVIGAVLNSIANGGQSTINVPNSTQSSSVPPGNETERMQAGNQSLAGNQAPSGQAFLGQAFQHLPHVVQIPMAAGAIPIPSLNAPIPDSLNTLSEFINCMEQALSQNGYVPNLSSTNPGDRVELPSNTQGLPTLEALTTVLHRAEQLLSGQAVAALSHIAGRMEREGTSADLGIRGQIQSESVQIGIAMQHLGALLLELGRTMLTLRMGRSSAESVVNAGPAVYISPSGPNPIMVQPFPLQTSSLFGGPLSSSTPATLGTVGVGSVPRNVNIHIHAGQMQFSSRDLRSESRPAQGNEQRDTLEMSGCAASSASSVGCTSESVVEKPETEAIKTCSNDERDVLVDKFVSSSSDQALQSCSSGETMVKSEKVPDTPSASERRDVTEPAKTAPLGLGVSGLERKRRTRLQPPAGKGADGGSSSSSINRGQETRTDSQHILQTHASQGSAVINADRPSSQQPIPSGGSQIDVGGLMSQVLHSSALNGLLEGFSQQTGADSSDGLRNMLQQFTQSPQMMNTVNQIAQQVGSQDMGNMLTGMERGQGGGVDFSRMLQQMMPIVSRALGGVNPPSLFSAAEPEIQAPYRDENFDNLSLQPDLQPVAERIDRLSPPTDVFRAVAENAVQLSGSGSAAADLLDELCCNESLASEYMEMLRYDVSELLEGGSERDKS